MVSQMDALESFAYLTDNIPDWFTQIEELTAHTSKRHAEFVAEYSRLLKHARPKRQKTPSMISQRSEDERRSPRPTPSATSHLDINPLEAGNRYLFANAYKKQKNTGHSVRSGASGPLKYRSKQAVVIYYDSHVQNTFESLVKNISTARNNLRKGKRARSLARGPMSVLNASYRMASFDAPGKLTITRPSLSPKVQLASTPNEDECFDLADQDLEQAQNLCETAAHQFLRDGDTKVELSRTKEKLENALEIAKVTVTKLKEEAELLRKELEESDTAVDDGDSGYGMINFQPDRLKTASTKNLSLNASESSLLGQAKQDDPVAEIEVDDDDSPGYDDLRATLNLGRYRNTLRPTVRA